MDYADDDGELIYFLGGAKNENDRDFYSQVYKYYYNRGFYPILFLNLSELWLLIFSIAFFLFFFAFIDWVKLLECKINNCGDIMNYIDIKFTPFEIFILIIGTMFLLYKFTVFIPKMKNLNNIYNYYTKTLEIKNNELYSLDWTFILDRIVKTSNKPLNVINLTNKIMRKENYMIALIENKIIDIPNFVYTKQMDENLKYIILNDYNDINDMDHLKLKRKFIMYGILNVVLSFVILLFQIGYFLTSNINDFYSSKNITGPRRYTTLAKIKFREYNELAHYFEERINKSMKYANKYNAQFESPNMEIAGKFIGLISGAFFIFFLIISILDENVLLYVTFFDRSLLFYMGIISAISSFTRTMIRNPEDSLYDPVGYMEKIIQHTHYCPKSWTDKFNKHEVRNEFLSLFQYKIVIFCHELISIFVTPYYLIFILPKKSKRICEFIKNRTIYIDCIGYVYNTYDERNLEDKMKSSFVFFSQNHQNSAIMMSSI
jgi:autophagy-related protein 9